jgi:hypothetical protein
MCGIVQQCELADPGHQVRRLWLWPACVMRTVSLQGLR